MHGKNAIIKSPPPNGVKQRGAAIVGILYGLEKVYNVVGLAEIVLNIVVLRRDAQLNKLIFESAALLEETMHLAGNVHNQLGFGLVGDKVTEGEVREIHSERANQTLRTSLYLVFEGGCRYLEVKRGAVYLCAFEVVR